MKSYDPPDDTHIGLYDEQHGLPMSRGLHQGLQFGSEWRMKDEPHYGVFDQSILEGTDIYGGMGSYGWEVQGQVVDMSSVENGRLDPSQAASFSPFTSSESSDAHSRGAQTPFGLPPSHIASTSHHHLNRIPRSARPHLQSYPDQHLSFNAFGCPKFMRPLPIHPCSTIISPQSSPL
jgi:hypothetical protein